MLRRMDLPVAVLPPEATQAEDADQTIEALAGEKPDWLVADHYALDRDWEQKVRHHAGRLMVIDDLADRHHQCDILLDQNYSPPGEQRYAGLVPDGCKVFIGPRYALLQPEYARYRASPRQRDGQVARVLVFFGGSDPRNATATALRALSGPGLDHLEVDVVVGALNPHRGELEQLARERRKTTIHGPRPHLADLMAAADLAIGAGGTTTWERMCLGLPSIVVSIADNQRRSCEVLAGAGLIGYAGDSAQLEIERLRQLILAACASPHELVEQSRLNLGLVDGLGTLRLREAMCPSPEHETLLRLARKDDVHHYFAWANDPQVRRNAINQSPIAWTDHCQWFTRKLGDRDSHLFVLETGGLPVGQIRFDLEGRRARISYSIDTDVRGRGWGRRLVALGLEQMRRVGPLRILAQVKDGNDASSAVFRRLGFTETPGTPTGLRTFHIDNKDLASKRDNT
jgi:UDP-2,4-diacetamido-2,4,6-trideoxy-beta-L-altropyranose hydrolase